MTNSSSLTLLALGLLVTSTMISCTPGERGALIGGAIGAGTGAIIGDETGALIGGALGAIAGSEISKNRAARNYYRQGGYYGPGYEEYYGPPRGGYYAPPRRDYYRRGY